MENNKQKNKYSHKPEGKSYGEHSKRHVGEDKNKRKDGAGFSGDKKNYQQKNDVC